MALPSAKIVKKINIGQHSIWYYGPCMKVVGGPWTYRWCDGITINTAIKMTEDYRSVLLSSQIYDRN
uniref:Uncharacterized protein n=1 Tax=Chelonoidis abingdonii TaxID=106734 RepID=A0A8C0GTB1_CHEAB